MLRLASALLLTVLVSGSVSHADNQADVRDLLKVPAGQASHTIRGLSGDDLACEINYSESTSGTFAISVAVGKATLEFNTSDFVRTERDADPEAVAMTGDRRDSSQGILVVGKNEGRLVVLVSELPSRRFLDCIQQ